jgi:hypothetical protein
MTGAKPSGGNGGSGIVVIAYKLPNIYSYSQTMDLGYLFQSV